MQSRLNLVLTTTRNLSSVFSSPVIAVTRFISHERSVPKMMSLVNLKTQLCIIGCFVFLVFIYSSYSVGQQDLAGLVLEEPIDSSNAAQFIKFSECAWSVVTHCFNAMIFWQMFVQKVFMTAVKLRVLRNYTSMGVRSYSETPKKGVERH